MTSFVCPLTFQIFHEPVIAEDGSTYDNDAIREWIRENHTSPITNQELHIVALKPNLDVKKRVEQFAQWLVSKNHKFKLSVDVQKDRRAWFQTPGKAIFKAEWLFNEERTGPPVVILKLDGIRSQKEADFYVKLSRHPHILRTYGLVDQNLLNPMSVMLLQEYAPIGNLFEVLIDELSVPQESVLTEIFTQIVDAMKYLAYNEVIHGDLACRNVLVFRFDSFKRKYNLVKLTDFGLSRGTALYTPIRGCSSTTTINTVPIRYAAPEVLANDTHSEKSDVFSMGVLIWEAYSKAMLPWAEETDEEVCRKVRRGERLAQPGTCGNDMWSIALKCMLHDAQDRPFFSDVTRLLNQLASENNNFVQTTNVSSVATNLSQMSLGTINYPNGSEYKGSLKDGKRYGDGLMIFANGNRYQGQFRDGKRHGHGIFTFANGRRYEGEFESGKRHGQGTYTSPRGYSYKGEFKCDKYDGQGTVQYENGDFYEGQFKNDKRHGDGSFKYANGDRYNGEFHNGKRTGKGSLEYADGSRYVGEFKDNNCHNQGIYTSVKGYRYEGAFENGMHHGYGTVTYEDGYRYEGIFTANKFNRDGTNVSIDHPHPH